MSAQEPEEAEMGLWDAGLATGGMWGAQGNLSVHGWGEAVDRRP